MPEAALDVIHMVVHVHCVTLVLALHMPNISEVFQCYTQRMQVGPINTLYLANRN